MGPHGARSGAAHHINSVPGGGPAVPLEVIFHSYAPLLWSLGTGPFSPHWGAADRSRTPQQQQAEMGLCFLGLDPHVHRLYLYKQYATATCLIN